jgi:hypothetical protein
MRLNLALTLAVLATALYVHLTRHCAPAAAQRNSGV